MLHLPDNRWHNHFPYPFTVCKGSIDVSPSHSDKSKLTKLVNCWTGIKSLIWVSVMFSHCKWAKFGAVASKLDWSKAVLLTSNIRSFEKAPTSLNSVTWLHFIRFSENSEFLHRVICLIPSCVSWLHSATFSSRIGCEAMNSKPSSVMPAPCKLTRTIRLVNGFAKEDRKLSSHFPCLSLFAIKASHTSSGRKTFSELFSDDSKYFKELARHNSIKVETFSRVIFFKIPTLF